MRPGGAGIRKGPVRMPRIKKLIIIKEPPIWRHIWRRVFASRLSRLFRGSRKRKEGGGYPIAEAKGFCVFGNTMGEKVMQSTIYVGLNDSETGVQKFSTEKYISILHSVCRNYQVAFSTYQINGGFFHEDGRYTEENTLVLMLMNVQESVVMEIAKDLCTFFHQESVMVTTAPCSIFFVNEKLDI